MKKKLFTALLLATALTFTTPILAFAGSWKQNTIGWWYQNDDGSWPANTWMKYNGSWYHFDQKGYMQTGWIYDSTTWYYLKSSGVMASNEWVGNYYLSSSGAMLTNTYTPDGYYVGADGAWIRNYGVPTEQWMQDSTGWWYQLSDGSYYANQWAQINGKWYHFNAKGYMQTGWFQDTDGKWYYLKDSGVMATNQWIGNYYVGNSGAMLTNTTTPDGYKVGPDGAYIPTASVGNTVYWTSGGKSYHSRRTCPTLARSSKIFSGSYNDAIANGKTDPCNVCVK